LTLVISDELSVEYAEAVASASGKKTLYVYDARNRKISESFPGHVPASLPNAAGYDKVLFNYDAMDRTITKIDQKGESTGFVFDLVGRLMTRSYPDNANDTFTYDTASRMLTAQSARYSNLVTRSYNPTSTLASESLSVAGKTYTVQYGYDSANRNTSITYPSGKVVTRGYSTRDELESVTYDSASVITRTYDAGRRLTGTTYGNSKVESRTYRNDNLLNTLATPGITALSYAWDANKNKTSETDTFVNAYSWTTGSGGYDSLDRLVSWSRTNGNAQSWNLSPVGNWNNWTYNGNQENRTHNAVHEITSSASRDVQYDPKGNTTFIEPASGYYTNSWVTTPTLVNTFWNYTWDYDNRMVSAISEGGDFVAYMTYDALGRRVSKANSSQQTIYVSSLQQEIAEYVSGANANAPKYEYVFGSYIDEVLMRVTSSSATKHYYHHDAQYCVRSLSDSTGAVVERYAYDPYGRPIYLTASGALSTTQSSSVNNTILYTGRRLDTETGLYYFRARYQDPVLGRFLSRDPIGFEDGENLFQYVRSNPTCYIDPDGTKRRGVIILPPSYPIPCPPFVHTRCDLLCRRDGFTGGSTPGRTLCYRTPVGNVADCDCKCNDCSTPPSRNSIYYQVHDQPSDANQHGCPSGHVHKYDRNQDPDTCNCFWNKDPNAICIPCGKTFRDVVSPSWTQHPRGQPLP
jgi:RHS repeat-associated protein